MRIGVLALQGGYAAHVSRLAQYDCATQLVKTPTDLQQVDGLIIPGGESSTLLTLLNATQLQQALIAFHAQQKPIFGTCAGMILLAREVTAPAQPALGFMDITVQRNAYGRQLDSRIVSTTDTSVSAWQQTPLELIFIRAPQIVSQGATVQTLLSYQGKPVCVQQAHCMAASFHPELGQDQRLHRYFIEKVQQHQ